MIEPLDIVIHTLGLPITGEDPVNSALGGSETAVVSMARALSRLGNRVTVSCVRPAPATRGGVEYVPAEQVAGYLKRHPCDLFLSCRHHQILDQSLPANMFGLWNHDMPATDFVQKHAAGLSKSSFAFFLSRFHRARFEECVPALSDFAVVTSNGIDFDALHETLGGHETAHRAAPTKAPIFVYGSRPERGLDFLLRRIWPRVLATCPDAELRVSSYDTTALALPPKLQEFYGFCRQLSAKTTGVVELGPLTRRQFWHQLGQSTAVLYPTNFPEISCMVALEAQAAGVPIVTSDAFALRETVGCADTRVGATWGTPEYVDRFVAIVRRLVEEPAFHTAVRTAGRRHVSRDSHSWDALASRWASLFVDRFQTRFETAKAGVFRTLVAAREVPAARRLAASVEPASVLDPLDLEQLRQLEKGGACQPSQAPNRPPSTEERIFRVAPRPKVSATLLVKDEEANLRRCVESFEHIVDEIIVADTGSSDLTLDVAATLGFAEGSVAPITRRRLIHVDFRDFAQARNELATHATGDYIYWQDADEILVGAPDLRRWIDSNVYFDAFALEQRHISLDPVAPDHPIRCFRRITRDGPLRWTGCVHESVEPAQDQPVERVAVFSDIHVAHLGFLQRSTALDKATGRNWNLFLKDRAENPSRKLGFLLGMREYVNLAKYEIRATGGPTTKYYRCLNHGFELWDQIVRHFPPAYRRVGFELSRQILELLALYDLSLRSTGQVPIEVEFSFIARRGGLGPQDQNVPSNKQFYASVEELREEFDRRLDDLECRLDGFERPAEILPDACEEYAHLELQPGLFDLEPADSEDTSDGAGA